MTRGFTTRTTPLHIEGAMTADDLWSRCMAAAKLAMRGKEFSHDDRTDCAADIAARHWAAAVEASAIVSVIADRRVRIGGDGASGGVMYSAKSRQKSKDDRSVVRVATDALRPDHAPSFGTLYGQASNWRRSLERRRVHETEIAARNAADSFGDAVIQDTPEELRSSPEAARDRAADMLGALGLPRLGKCFPMAYRAARQSMGGDVAAELIAKELGTTLTALDMSQSRARKRIPSLATMDKAAHADALHIPTGGVALKPSKTRAEHRSFLDGGDSDWRTRPETEAPVTVRTDRRLIRKHDRRPAWTEGLPPTTAARLAKAAELRRERAAEKGSDDA